MLRRQSKRIKKSLRISSQMNARYAGGESDDIRNPNNESESRKRRNPGVVSESESKRNP